MLTKDPSNSNRILASVGSPVGNASEIQESNNFGDQWQSLGAALRYTYYWIAHDISIHPGNPYDILCGGVEVFKFNRASSTLDRRSQWNTWYYDNTLNWRAGRKIRRCLAILTTSSETPNNPDVVYLATDGVFSRH
ncbi:MAG: hypothetical protein IPN15_03850 [Saprospiraceae bacterium]|nr:hypothetical protein [Candidatus Vicinibacter affinis]